MNVNSARFHLLLGRPDWERCAEITASGMRTLRQQWAPSQPPAGATLRWDEPDGCVRLLDLPPQWTAAPTDLPVAADDRRGAAADQYGNIYWIDQDRRGLRVRSAGSPGDAPFWSHDPAAPEAAGDFAAAAAPPANLAREFRTLAVTVDRYLVAAFAGATRGLLAFDLLAGGPPLELLWPSPGFDPLDLVARCGGGVWLLERGGVLWQLDRRLQVVGAASPPAEVEDDFGPQPGAPRKHPAAVFAGAIDLHSPALAANPADHPVDAIAVEATDDGAVLLLDVDAGNQRSRVLRYRCDGAGALAASAWLTWQGSAAPFIAQDFVRAAAGARPPASGETSANLLWIATQQGDQAVACSIDAGAAFALTRLSSFVPMRRYGGRGLVAVRGAAWYDSATNWVPLVPQTRWQYCAQATLVTRSLDSGEPQCVWDRLLLDGTLPPDTGVEISSRAGDELLQGDVVGDWVAEPRPYLRGDGSELPWLRADAYRARRPGDGGGTWELLLQSARGRYLQLRVRLYGNGRATPRLRALRAWYPRFSWSERYLPGCYREEPVAASFAERFLANFEGICTALEGRIAGVQALLDPRSAPADTLPWLASWFDVALDPAWDDNRQRLFIRHAMDFFNYRGTVHGLRMALALAFDSCIVEDELGPPPAGEDRAAGDVRIVETFLTRRINPVVAGDPGADPGPRVVDPAQLWSPAEGNAGLVQRLARAAGRTATVAEEVRAFPLSPPADAAAQPDAEAQWRSACSSAFGFVPAMGAAERSRWQLFLRARYADVGALNSAHGADYAGFADVALPADAPAEEVGKDWQDYLDASAAGSDALTRDRWQEFLARRYRRIERLNRTWGTHWTTFAQMPLPDCLPVAAAAQADWLQFEGVVAAMQARAHRFSVLLPVRAVDDGDQGREDRLRLARRIVELEKPAHTVFDVRFYWALFRIGEARLGMDTLLDQGSRAPQLVPDAVLGRAYVGAGFVGGAARPRDADRLRVDC